MEKTMNDRDEKDLMERFALVLARSKDEAVGKAQTELSALRAENEALRADLVSTEARQVWQRERAEAAEAKVSQQSELIIELGAKLNATKQREEGLEGRVARLAEALKNIDDRVNNEGDDSQACVSDIGHIARSAIADLRETEGVAALQAERARAKGMEKVLLEAEKWIDVRPKFDKSFIDTDYAREILALADSLSPSPAKEPSEICDGTNCRRDCCAVEEPCDRFDGHAGWMECKTHGAVLPIPPAVEKPAWECKQHSTFGPSYLTCAPCLVGAPAVEKPVCGVCRKPEIDHPIYEYPCRATPAVAPVESLTEDEGCKDCGGKGEIMTACDGDGGPPIMDWEPCPRGCAPGEGV